MHSGDLFPSSKQPQIQWEGLEKRINGLLEGIVQLRNANAQIMKENVHLKNQLKEQGPAPAASTDELQKTRQQYEEALKDLKQVRANLARIESLAADLKLEG